jgi:methyltransferase (TIGR00027 family)
MHQFATATAFYVLNIVLFPITLLGYVLWTGSLLLRQRGGVSATALGPLSARWFAHSLGTRPDEPAARLLRVLPGVPPLAPRLVAGPLLLAHRVTGYVPRVLRYPFEGEVSPQLQVLARTTFFDGVVERHIPPLTQFVVLGAGFDTRAFRLPASLDVRAFEIDMPQTQTLKRCMVAQAGIEAAHVTFVGADFEQDDWMERLLAAGFDPGVPALFLWEGVTMYLDQRAVEHTLRTIANTAAGGVVAFDYLTTEPLAAQGLYWRYARAATNLGGEPITWGIDRTPPVRDRIAELLGRCGLALVEHQTLGSETGSSHAWGGFAAAIVIAEQE